MQHQTSRKKSTQILISCRQARKVSTRRGVDQRDCTTHLLNRSCNAARAAKSASESPVPPSARTSTPRQNQPRHTQPEHEKENPRERGGALQEERPDR
jgi:hypothetical protein